MLSGNLCFILCCGLILFAGCSKNQDAVKTADADTSEAAALPIEHFYAIARKHLPAESYMTNTFIEQAHALTTAPVFAKTATLRVGMPWVDNDENAPWYIGVEKGFFADAGLQVEIVSGGPGLDHLLTLLSGKIDIAVINDSSRVTKLLASPTPGELMMIGAVLQSYPGSFLTIDTSIDAQTRSSLTFTPRDFIGKNIGVPIHSEFILDAMLEKYQIPKSKVNIIRSGNDPYMLIAGRVEYISGWVVNQPRILEEQGYQNWAAMRYSEVLYEEYADMNVVTQETAAGKADVLVRYIWALRQAIYFLLNNPEESARITQKYTQASSLTVEQMLWRFEQQAPLIMPQGKEHILTMDPDVLDTITAHLIKYKIIELP